MKLLIVLMILVCASFAFADEMGDLTDVRGKLNVQIIRITGQIDLNNTLSLEFNRSWSVRARRLELAMSRLEEQLALVNNAIKTLEAVPVELD
jgi:hypothetical protein